ncbi:MAG: DEAD/DEAH box helicase [Rhodocyclaceae bacterium]|nr:DEAD/DEAH box helicase [Rhodocyclaceae bacterium]
MMPDLLPAALAAEFDSATLQRGQVYAAQYRAVIQRITGSGRELHIEGRCRGSRFYDVDIWLNLDDKGQLLGLDNTCSCPVGIDCKHVVALLLTTLKSELLPRQNLRLAGGDDATTRRKTLAWLDTLGAPAEPARGAPVGRSSPRCMVYLLHPGTPTRLSVGRSRLLKKGGLGKPALFRPQSYDLSDAVGDYSPGNLSESDALALRIYLGLATAGAYNVRNDVECTGELGALLLRKTLATGRLFAVSPTGEANMETPLRPAEARTLDLAWRQDDAGRQCLTPNLPPGGHLLFTWPLFTLDPQAGTVGELRSDMPENLLLNLLRAPPLREDDAPLVREHLTRLAQEHALTLPLPETACVAEAGEPVGRLTLTIGRFRHHAMISMTDEHALAELCFDYPGGLTVAGEANPATLVRHQGADEPKRTLRRNLAAENAALRQLREWGLEFASIRMPGYHRVDRDDPALLQKRQDASAWLPLLSDGISALEQAGITVTLADDFPYRLTEADDWFVALEEDGARGSDWFDLDLGVLVEGERISLVSPLLRLMRAHPQLLATVRALEEGQTYPVAIDDRRILPVPAARLKAWLLPLLEFLDDDRPRLSRHHAAALAGLEETATHWIGGEALRALGQRLRDFSGIVHAPPAAGFTTTLRPYQQVGLDWLQFLREFGLAGILADDMGLGKTVQTLAHLHLEKTSGRADRPSLVVAPTSLMANWRNEAAQFTPELKVLVLHGPDRAERFGEISAADLIVTTYPLLVRDRETLLAQDFHLLVLDEAQFIKNPKAQSHQVARQLNARHRLSLTGTPLENHLGELWAQFDFLMPGLLGTAKRFVQIFRTPIEKQNDGEARALLAERVRPFLLRRTKEHVLKELPPRTEMIRWVELAGGQRDLYESLRVAFDKKLRQALVAQGVGRSQIMILDALLKLRQACCDPRLVKLPAAEKLGRQGLAASAKLSNLLELLEELLDEGRRVLLFSQFTSMLGLIEAELNQRSIRFVKLTGQTRDRETPIREFQEGRVSLFLISLKAGGTGLNLTAADTVIHYDPWWNPAVEEQATARAHRIGQDKPVFVYKLMTEGTVEEKILALQDRKRGLADQLVKGRGDAGDPGGGHLLTSSDLDVLFQPLSPG